MREHVMAEVERQIARWKKGGSLPSVAAVATACGISRQAVYRSHRTAVLKLQSLRRDSKHPAAASDESRALKLELLRERYEREKAKVKLLTTLTGELATALMDSRELLAQEKARSERYRRRLGRK
jgi:hypothetical protein